MVNPQRIEMQLTPAFGKDRAMLLANLADGLGGVLSDNPMTAALMSPHIFPALAILYATAVRATNQAIASEPEGSVIRTAAETTRNEMMTIVEACSAPGEQQQPSSVFHSMDELIEQLRQQSEAEQVQAVTEIANALDTDDVSH